MSTHSRKTAALDLVAIRARLQGAHGRQYWRSLEEAAASEEFQEVLQREFPHQAAEWHDPISRRRFLQLMAASLALAGLSACQAPAEKIMPYVRTPEEIIPGKPLFFATAMPLSGGALGVLAESHLGRPTKIEGNPQHPASLGATHALAQGSVLTLYDPDRSQAVTYAGRISGWGTFLGAMSRMLAEQRHHGGRGLRLLTETVTSPTLGQQLQQVLDRFPAAKWHQYEPVNRSQVWEGLRLAFGRYLEPQYRFDAATIVLALDADFLSCEPGSSVRYAHDFASRRQVRQGQTAMNRLYVVESTHSNTGAFADHHLALRPSDIPHFAYLLARELGVVEAHGLKSDTRPRQASSLEPQSSLVRAIIGDLRGHPGDSLILAGEQQPPIVHALAHAMNHALGNVGRTVVYTDPVAARPLDQMASLRDLVADMEAGQVECCVIIGGNPVYTAPADLHFAEQLAKVKLRIHLGLYADETAALCHWHLPESHYLEAWGDTRAYDGTVTIMQPLIAPLYAGHSAHELLAVLLGEFNPSGYQIVRDYWRGHLPAEDFEPFWRTALHGGVIAGTAFTPRHVDYQGLNIEQEDVPATTVDPRSSVSTNLEPQASLELVFRPDPTVWDGRFANNGWLQELPKPLTQLTWDNTALLSPAVAGRLGLSNEEVVELRYQGRTVQAPVWIMPGHADHTVTVTLGYGRWRAGRVGTNTGFNAYALRTSSAPWIAQGLEIRKTGGSQPLATTQSHHSMEGRHIVRAGTLAQYLTHPEFVHDLGHDPPRHLSLYPEYASKGHAWGMAIDLNVCIGCNVCVIACQAENNIPIVGKTEVIRGREMHWLRVDRYYKGDLDHPETYFQPVPCMHCENAPCEVVCPVAATAHSAEGLNDMVYNRCIGTRYCSNNCPYKVRRFNFLQYADYHTDSLKLLRNPDVTVRSRGVMEKCTYCVQRINAARIEAQKENRMIRDGEVVTACQAACPTGAIVFGDINNPSSRVSAMKATPLHYGLLTELNTRPRTTYLARLRNPHPDLAAGEEHG
jgi:MoCo/4Fe-4S cofactor protein with predicted Tat translocation signal